MTVTTYYNVEFSFTRFGFSSELYISQPLELHDAKVGGRGGGARGVHLAFVISIFAVHQAVLVVVLFFSVEMAMIPQFPFSLLMSLRLDALVWEPVALC